MRNPNNQCGYRGLGHYCAEDRVLFISRYRDTNDYCVDGRRVSVSDTGELRNALPGDAQRIYDFELAKYQEYLAERETRLYLQSIPLSPFDCGIAKAVQS